MSLVRLSELNFSTLISSICIADKLELKVRTLEKAMEVTSKVSCPVPVKRNKKGRYHSFGAKAYLISQRQQASSLTSATGINTSKPYKDLLQVYHLHSTKCDDNEFETHSC